MSYHKDRIPGSPITRIKNRRYFCSLARNAPPNSSFEVYWTPYLFGKDIYDSFREMLDEIIECVPYQVTKFAVYKVNLDFQNEEEIEDYELVFFTVTHNEE